MRRRIILGLSVLLVFAALGSRLARADAESGNPPESSVQAEAHVSHGLELRRQRRDAEALVEFRAAYALQKSGRVLAQIALAEDAVGLWVEAEGAFEEVLASRNDAWVEKRRDALAEELRVIRMHLADLDLAIIPATADVWLNGSLAHRNGATGAFRVVSGRILVEVKAPGFETGRRVLEVQPGARSRETIALAEIPAPALPQTGTESPRPASVIAETTPPPATARHDGRKTSLPRIVAFSSFGLAGAAIVVGTVGAIERAASMNEYNDNSRCDRPGSQRSVQCAGVANDFGRFTTVMVAGYVTAGAATVAGGVLALAFPGQVRVDVTPRGTTGFVVKGEWAF